MQKKKIFSYKSETLETKELEEDLKQAEQIIAKLKDNLDPEGEKAKRKQQLRESLFDCLTWLFVALFVLMAFTTGYASGMKQAESIYNYSVSIGAITTTE